MRRGMRLFCIMLLTMIIVSSFSGCNSSKTTEINKERYDTVINGFGQEDISIATDDAVVKAEYRVVYNVACQRYDFYSLQIYKDGTGKFHYMVHKSEDFDRGEIILDKISILNSAKVQNLLEIIEDNHFFKLKTFSKKNVIELDGRTVFIEGLAENQYNYIKVWNPDEKNSAHKIYKAFADFATTFTERPVIRFDTKEDEIIANSVDTFLNSLSQCDVASFQSLMKDEVRIMRYFCSGNDTRGKTIKGEYGQDTVLRSLSIDVEGEIPIDLTKLFPNAVILENPIKILGDYKSIPVFEYSINQYVEDIKEILAPIPLIDNQPTIIKMENGFMLIEVLIIKDENVVSFVIGHIAVFERINEHYYLQSIIDTR